MAEEVTIDTTSVKLYRPNYLIAACILSYIGCGWTFLSGFLLLIKANAQVFAVTNMKAIVYSDDFHQKMNGDTSLIDTMAIADKMVIAFTAGNLRIIGLTAMVSAIVSFKGALMMWYLNKKGFWYYLSGTLFGLLILSLLYGFTKTIALGIIAFNGIITLFTMFGASEIVAEVSSGVILFTWLIFMILYLSSLRFMTQQT